MKTIIAWVILILLLLVPPIFAHDSTRINWDELEVVMDSIVAAPLWSPVDTLRGWQRDTTRYYIKEIKQKCDTADYAIVCAVYRCDCKPKLVITCVDNTVWAEKVQVWLTPTQLEYLMEMIKEREQWELDVEVGRWSPIKN